MVLKYVFVKVDIYTHTHTRVSFKQKQGHLCVLINVSVCLTVKACWSTWSLTSIISEGTHTLHHTHSVVEFQALRSSSAERPMASGLERGSRSAKRLNHADMSLDAAGAPEHTHRC